MSSPMVPALCFPAVRRLGAIALALVLLGGCDDPASRHGKMHGYQVSQQLAPPAQQVFRRSLPLSPRTLDPSLATDIPSTDVLEDLFEGLTAADASGKLVPGVASHWEISEDGLRYVFHLRPEARWSNGAPLTAQDFVYAWRREVDPATGAQYAQSLLPIVNASQINNGQAAPDTLGVRALDPHTLEVRLVQRTPYFLAMLDNAYFYPLYAPAIQRYGEQWTQPGKLVGNGAFTLQQAVINGHLTLDKNPYYWDAAKVQLQQVIDYPIFDPASGLERYLADDLDYVGSPAFPASDLGWLRQQLGTQVVVSPYYGTAYLGMLLHQPPFNNPALRQALSMALDRHILSDKLQHGLSLPAYSLVPPLPGFTARNPDWASWPSARRLAEARRLYQAAGYSAAHPLKVELLVPAGGAGAADYVEALTTMWRQNLGAQISIHQEQWKVMLQDVQYKNAKLFWSAWIGDYPTPYTFMQQFQQGFAMNYGDYANPQYDALLQQAGREQDPVGRYAVYAQAETLLNQDMPYIPLYYYTAQSLLKPYVRGWAPNILDRHPSRYIAILAHQRED